MGVNVNQLKRERLAIFREFKRAMRRVDSAQEAAERLINRVLARKSFAPDTEDFLQLIALLKETGGRNADLLKLAEQNVGNF